MYFDLTFRGKKLDMKWVAPHWLDVREDTEDLRLFIFTYRSFKSLISPICYLQLGFILPLFVSV